MAKETSKEAILRLLKTKSSMKQDVYECTLEAFKHFKSICKELATELNKETGKADKRVTIVYTDKGEFEAELKVAGDILFFYMHTNVFEFDRSHQIRKSSYVKEDEYRSYCGQISVYNFLSDSFKYNRVNDVGYLIGRVFINREKHYFVEGKKQLGFLYNDFSKGILDKEQVRKIVEAGVQYSLEFDLFTPPFEAVRELKVAEVLETSMNMKVQTGKRLGFRFQSDTDIIVPEE
ncbi:MAG TPA: hypothetical protein VNZ86_02275 [Bacteroidia bacterium]|jgi:hypothetical protein|nr:hypothetical protein [Bacteroidia bacterium]